MRDLLRAATVAMDNAYAPYSGFRVGAAVRGARGGIYAGCNVENAAYPESLCAEAAAIAAMILDGERELIEALVVTDGDRPCTPCGGCRQKLHEFGHDRVPVHCVAADRIEHTIMLGELLPSAFGRATMGLDPDG